MIKFNLPTLVTLTAPTCAGKSYLLEALVDRLGFTRLVSTTDRTPRDGEVEGVHYFFISTEQSKQMEAEGKFAELVTYNGTRYGVMHEEMRKKVSTSLPPPIVILEPKGLEIYHKYCSVHGWKLFSIYVETPEQVRLQRLVERTTVDVMKAAAQAHGFTREEAALNARITIEKVISTSHKRLQAILEQERNWSHKHHWDVIVDGTNLEKALADIEYGIKYRNARTDIYA